MSQQHKVEIHAWNDIGTRVWLDDMELRGVRNIQWRNPVGTKQQVVITLLTDEVTVQQGRHSGVEDPYRLQETQHG